MVNQNLIHQLNLGGLCLASTSWTFWCSSKVQVKCTDKCTVTTVCQWCNNKPRKRNPYDYNHFLHVVYSKLWHVPKNIWITDNIVFTCQSCPGTHIHSAQLHWWFSPDNCPVPSNNASGTTTESHFPERHLPDMKISWR